MYLLDTNIISELRRALHGQANPGVAAWARATPARQMRTSVIVLLEIETGILRIERKDEQQGAVLRRWYEQSVQPAFGRHALNIDSETCRLCAELRVPNERNTLDALIAASALQHGLTLVTRNERDFQGTGVRLLNPFSG